MTLEADTKLVEDALETMKLIGAKGVDSPRVRKNEEQTIQIESSKNLTSVESTLCRSSVMKLAYVAQDRIYIAEVVTCLHKTHARATECNHAGTQEVGSIPGEKKTNVGSNVASAHGL